VRAGARWLGVTCVEEGVAARAVCPEVRILVIGGAFPGQGAAVVEHGLSVVAWEPWQLDELEGAAHAAGAAAGSVPVHLEIDTGMSRQGVAPELLRSEAQEADALARILERFTPGSPLRLEGVMTHLFAADEADGAVTAMQLERLAAALGRVGEAGMLPEWLNVGNSAALLAGQAEKIAGLAARHGMKALLRPGLALYGLIPQFNPRFEPQEPPSLTAARARLQPVLSWKTRVAGVRSIPAGAVVGYNGTFVATEPMRLALVAAGYADGLDRRLGNRFSLLVRGARAPLVGRVSMDQAVVDVTGIPGVEAGDEVMILGSQRGDPQGGETITAFDLAEATGTIPWEVFTRIGARVSRVAV
jgi:alanine racemase